MICRAKRSPSGNDSFSATGALFDRRRNRFYRVGRQPNRHWHSPVTGAPDARCILRRRAVSSGDRGRTAYETRRNRRSFIVSAPAIFGSFASLQRNSPPKRRNALIWLAILRFAPSATANNSSDYGQTQTGRVRSWTLPIRSGVYCPAPGCSDA